MPRRARGLLYRALAGVAVAGALLVGTEGALRLAGDEPAYVPRTLPGWQVAPGLLKREVRGPTDGHGFLVTTNGDGLRTTLEREAPPRGKRIALLGDSTVFGWGVADDEHLGAALERALAPTAVEVLNAGQPGYSSTQIGWLAEEVVSAYHPDVVVVFLPVHDLNLVLVSDREYLEGGATPGAELRVWLARESRIYARLRRLVYDDADQPMLAPPGRDVQREGEPRVPRTSDAERVLALDAIGRAFPGAVLYLGYLPGEADKKRGAPVHRLTGPWAKAEAARRGWRSVDLRGACLDLPGLLLPDDPSHLSAEGLGCVGGALAEVLRPDLGAPAAPAADAAVSAGGAVAPPGP